MDFGSSLRLGGEMVGTLDGKSGIFPKYPRIDNQTRKLHGVDVDWRMVVTGYVPEIFIYHDSIDEALNIAIREGATCPGCKRPDRECPEYCPEYDEWWFTTGRYEMGYSDD